MKCEICNKHCENIKTLAHHINLIHKNEISSEEYYYRYLKKFNEDICPTCGKKNKFIGYSQGYSKFCSLKCDPNIDKSQICTCMICKEEFECYRGLSAHIRQNHKTDREYYFNTYMKNELCNKCSKSFMKNCLACTPSLIDVKETCKLCGRIFIDRNSLCVHLTNSHSDVNKKDYYDKYLKKDNEGICPVCGSSTDFVDLSFGYKKHCGIRCSQLNPETKEKVKLTCQEKYGSDTPFDSSEIQQKIHLGQVKRFGCLAFNTDTMKNTCLDRYGVANGGGSKEAQEKIKQTRNTNIKLDKELEDPDE